MIALLANLGIYLGFFAVLALPALFRKQTRGWVIVLMIVVLGDMAATIVGGHYQDAVFAGHVWNWNWFGKGLSLAFGLIVAIILIASRKFRAREIGLSFLQAPGTGRALLIVVLPYLALLIVLTATLFGGPKLPPVETLLFQATMPGLAEELAFRGILLALFDRMFAGRFHLLGAELGYGAIATSLIFGLGHVVTVNAKFVLHLDIANGLAATAIAFVLVWIRCRSRSLVLPVVVHNLTNIIFDVVPKVI